MTTADLPFLTIKKYSELTGETEAAVRQQVYAGNLPIRPRGKDRGRIYINMRQLAKMADAAKY
jgi:hypothetical protein